MYNDDVSSTSSTNTAGPANVTTVELNQVPATRNLDNADMFMTFKLYENVASRQLIAEDQSQKFSSYVNYLLYCLSLTGSLANISRFPYLAYIYNGCSFVVQFLILVLFIGIPWCLMETALGQYTGRGPTALGDMVPIGKGVAAAMGYICLLNIICYCPIQAKSLLYMYWSVATETLPWEFCSISNVTECVDQYTQFSNTERKSVGIELHISVEEFYLNKIAKMDNSILHNGLGVFNSPLLVCHVISWIINYMLLLASNNYLKYLQIFGSVMPFVLLFVVLGITMTDDDAWHGFRTLFNASTVDFLDIQSWRRAAEQVMYSLDVGTGHLFIYGKSCSFRNNILDSIRIVSFLNVLCVIVSSMIVFGVAQTVANKFHFMFHSVFVSGPGMVFIVISWSMLKSPFPRTSSFLAFFIIFVVCILTQLSFLRPINYLLNICLQQYNLNLNNYMVGIICLVILGMALITVTTGGDMLISLLEDVGTSMGILTITTFEAILVFCVYGTNEFCADLAFMLDKPPSIVLKMLFILAPKVKEAFAPTDHWVPDIAHSLKSNKLECMMKVREKIVHNNNNSRSIFGVSKPRLNIKLDEATQTDNRPSEPGTISDQRLQHIYLEVFNDTSKPFELVRKHDENEKITSKKGHINYLLDSKLLEKYIQTD